MASTAYDEQKKTEAVTAHVLWMTTGLSCEGDSVAMTSATNPSLEDIILQAIPGMPKVVVHNQVIDYMNGQEYAQAWFDAEEGKLDPFVLVIEGSLGNEEINGDGFWTGFAVNPENGQPITMNEWIDRLAPKCGGGGRGRHLRHLRRHPGDEEQPDRRDGRARLSRLELEVESRAADRVHPRMPRPAGQHDRGAALPGAAPGRARAGAGARRGAAAQVAVRAHRARELQPRRVRRAGRLRHHYGNDHRCLVKLGCKGPVVKCNVPVRGWVNGIGGCPNVGGICMACTMPGFPDKFMPFMDPDRWGKAASHVPSGRLRPDGAVLP